jgi:hypothetical protein
MQGLWTELGAGKGLGSQTWESFSILWSSLQTQFLPSNSSSSEEAAPALKAWWSLGMSPAPLGMVIHTRGAVPRLWSRVVGRPR